MAHNYDVGTKAWQPDASEGWVASEVISRTEEGDKITLVFELANGEVCSKSNQAPQVAEKYINCTDPKRRKPSRFQQQLFKTARIRLFLH